MDHDRRINELAKQGLDHWGDGRLPEAKSAFQSAVALADPAHGATVDLHCQLASVLSAMGEAALAGEHFGIAVNMALGQGQRNEQPSLLVLRHFWAAHLLRNAQRREALEVLVPSLDARPDSWLLRFTEAEIRLALGEQERAQTAATLAIAHAPSAEKASQLRELWAERLREDVGDHSCR